MWGARIFSLVDRWLNCGLNAVRVLHQGFWLGILSPQAFHQIHQQQYAAWEKYQDPAYNRSGLFSWEQQILGRFFASCQSILLGAAGGGRELLALAQQGVQVDAFECCPELLAGCQRLAATAGLASRIVLAPPDQVPKEFGVYDGVIYDGVIVGWGAYTHLASADTRIGFLKQLRRHVQPGGPLLVSFFVRRGETRQLRWIFRIARFLRRLQKHTPPVELGDTLCGTFDHYFSQAEIAHELAAAGFQLEWYREEPYGHAVGRAVVATETEQDDADS